MRRRTIQTLVLGSIGIAVITVCSLAILTSNAKSQTPENAFSVSIREKRSIRPVGREQSRHVYNCRASAEACAKAAVQEVCGNNEYEITFKNVHVDADGKLDGQWGYRCFSPNSLL